jgi:hypothetical protein
LLSPRNGLRGPRRSAITTRPETGYSLWADPRWYAGCIERYNWMGQITSMTVWQYERGRSFVRRLGSARAIDFHDLWWAKNARPSSCSGSSGLTTARRRSASATGGVRVADASTLRDLRGAIRPATPRIRSQNWAHPRDDKARPPVAIVAHARLVIRSRSRTQSGGREASWRSDCANPA